MLRPLLASLAIAIVALPALASFVLANDPAGGTDAPPAATIPYSEMRFDSSLLPGPTGWFAVPVTVDQPAYVRVDMDLSDLSDGPMRLGQVILAIEGRESFPFVVVGGPGPDPELRVAHEGDVIVECCDDLQTGWSSGHGGAGLPFLLSPGEVLWVGFAAYRWDELSYASIALSAQANLAIGEARTGLKVDAVDLYEAARLAGTSAGILSRELTLQPGSVERTWHAEQYGIFSLRAFHWGDEGDARVRIEVPGETARVGQVASEGGVFASVHRAGDYRVVLDELRAPLTHQGALMQVFAIFADIDVPGDAAFIYP